MWIAGVPFKIWYTLKKKQEKEQYLCVTIICHGCGTSLRHEKYFIFTFYICHVGFTHMQQLQQKQSSTDLYSERQSAAVTIEMLRLHWLNYCRVLNFSLFSHLKKGFHCKQTKKTCNTVMCVSVRTLPSYFVPTQVCHRTDKSVSNV